MEWINFNLNEMIKVQLTDLGHEVYKRNIMKLAEWAAPHNFDKQEELFNKMYKRPEEDEDGWSQWQAHELMSEFGKHLNEASNDLPFKTTIKLKTGG